MTELDNIKQIILDENDKITEKKHLQIKDLKDLCKINSENLPKSHKPFVKTVQYRNWDVRVEKLVCMTKTELEGEKWKFNKTYKVEVSNFGRIKKDGFILNQFEEHDHKDGWLKVRLNGTSDIYVYRLVGETWLKKPSENYTIVHHINENGYENTPENLLWVTQDQHSILHGFKN